MQVKRYINGVLIHDSGESWPFWARVLKQFAIPEDKGIGDVVARIIGHENSEAFQAWHLKVIGSECGCKDRQRLWNLQYPLV